MLLHCTQSSNCTAENCSSLISLQSLIASLGIKLLAESQCFSIYFHLCPNLKWLVHTIHFAMGKEPWCREYYFDIHLWSRCWQQILSYRCKLILLTKPTRSFSSFLLSFSSQINFSFYFSFTSLNCCWHSTYITQLKLKVLHICNINCTLFVESAKSKFSLMMFCIVPTIPGNISEQ